MEHETELPDMRPLLLKRFVWDIFPHDFELVGEMQKQLGLVPDHDEGLEVEHRASDTRINRAAPLATTLRTLSELSAEIMANYVLANLEDEDIELDEDELPEDFVEEFISEGGDMIYDGVYAIFCHLLDTGVITYGEKVRRNGREELA